MGTAFGSTAERIEGWIVDAAAIAHGFTRIASQWIGYTPPGHVPITPPDPAPPAVGEGARFIARTGGEILDITRIRIPGPRNSPFGKVDYLLGTVGSIKSVGKGGFFRGVLGFSEGNLGPALKRHLIENFGSATIEGSRIRAIGTLVGPGGRSATVQSVWQVTPDGFVDLITAVPR